MKKSDYVAMRTAVIKGRKMGWDIIDVEYINGDQDDDQTIVNDGGRVVSAVRMAVGAGSERTERTIGALAANGGYRKIEMLDCAMRLEMIVNAYSNNVLVAPVVVMGSKTIALVPAGWATIASYLKYLDAFSCVVDCEDDLWEKTWERNSSAQTQLEDIARGEERLRAEAQAKAADEADQLEFLSLIAAFNAKAD